MVGHASEHHQPGQNLYHIGRPYAAGSPDRQTLSAVFVDGGQQPHPCAVMEPQVHEVAGPGQSRPAVIRGRCRQERKTRSRIWRGTATSAHLHAPENAVTFSDRPRVEGRLENGLFKKTGSAWGAPEKPNFPATQHSGSPPSKSPIQTHQSKTFSRVIKVDILTFNHV